MRDWSWLEGSVPPFFSGCGFFQVIDVPVLVRCPRRRGATFACVSNPRKNSHKEGSAVRELWRVTLSTTTCDAFWVWKVALCLVRGQTHSQRWTSGRPFMSDTIFKLESFRNARLELQKSADGSSTGVCGIWMGVCRKIAWIRSHTGTRKTLCNQTSIQQQMQEHCCLQVATLTVQQLREVKVNAERFGGMEKMFKSLLQTSIVPSPNFLFWKEAFCHCKKACLSPWTGWDKNGEGCGERHLSDKLKLWKMGRKEVSSSGLALFPSSNKELVRLSSRLLNSLNIFCVFYGMTAFLLFECVPLCFAGSRKSKGGLAPLFEWVMALGWKEGFSVSATLLGKCVPRDSTVDLRQCQ